VPSDCFRDIDSPITLAFLTRFPSQAKADWLSPARLQAWLRSARYNNPTNAGALHAHLTAAPRGTIGPEAAARAAITLAMGAALSAIRSQIKALEDQITAQLAAHPDGHIFTSLPRAGTVRAAPPARRDRRRPRPLPHPGVPGLSRRGRPFDTPVRQGQGRLVPLGDRGHDHPHAVRILARAWLHVICRCWQDRVPYNPASHRALQRLLAAAA
jgi:hypothetical protein